jgi:hypothetical protein
MRLAHDGASASGVERCTAAAYLPHRRRRSEAMFNLFKSLIDERTERPVSELERAYLNAAVSRHDLERREREVERGLFRIPYPYF